MTWAFVSLRGVGLRLEELYPLVCKPYGLEAESEAEPMCDTVCHFRAKA